MSVNEEGLIFRRGRILQQSFVDPFYAAGHRHPSGYAAFAAKNYLLRRVEHDVESGLWVTDNFSPGSYHHWLIDSLPRLLEAERSAPEEDVLLLPRSIARTGYVTFTLNAFPGISRIARIGARANVRVGRLAAFPRPAEYRPDVLGEVAHRVAALAGEAGTGRRIYLSRANATRRRARNEADVRRVLRAHGFEIVEIDGRDPAQQVRVCRGAAIVVGVHGADLSNVIFMAPGGRLLELRREEVAGLFFFDHYRWLARAMGISYRALECAVTDPVDGPERNNSDLVVDLDALRAGLEDEWSAPPEPVRVPVGFGGRPTFEDPSPSP